mgnify:CR=1 FL=1
MSQHIKHGCDHIFFIGFLGAGKSTLARNVGTMFKRRFIDTDRLVVRRCGKSVTEIFETEGEDRFRELETSALRSLQSERSLLVSCGGGIVETPVNIELMHKMGTCVYLEGDFEDSLRQIRRSDTRPDFRSPEHAARLFEHRRPLYRQAADITLDIRNKSFEDVPTFVPRCFWSVDCYDSPSTYQFPKPQCRCPRRIGRVRGAVAHVCLGCGQTQAGDGGLEQRHIRAFWRGCRACAGRRRFCRVAACPRGFACRCYAGRCRYRFWRPVG